MARSYYDDPTQTGPMSIPKDDDEDSQISKELERIIRENLGRRDPESRSAQSEYQINQAMMLREMAKPTRGLMGAFAKGMASHQFKTEQNRQADAVRDYVRGDRDEKLAVMQEQREKRVKRQGSWKANQGGNPMFRNPMGGGTGMGGATPMGNEAGSGYGYM